MWISSRTILILVIYQPFSVVAINVVNDNLYKVHIETKLYNYTAGILPAAQQMPQIHVYSVYLVFVPDLLCILVYSRVYSHTMPILSNKI